jgi:hypothetical protein
MLSARDNYCPDQVTSSGAEPSHPTTIFANLLCIYYSAYYSALHLLYTYPSALHLRFFHAKIHSTNPLLYSYPIALPLLPKSLCCLIQLLLNVLLVIPLEPDRLCDDVEMPALV